MTRAAGTVDDSDLAGELAAVAGRRWWNRATLYLGAVVLLIGGFVGGVQVQKSYGDPPGGGPAAATGRGGQRGAGGFAGFPGGGSANRPGGTGTATGSAAAPGAEAGAAPDTTGTVKLVDGGTVYLQTADGSLITVRTSADTAVAVARAGSLADLKPGDTVTVVGPNSAGTVTATKVTAEQR
ncbi:hypothetical protein BDK92_1977 [Micromonospora pisi]|uniref:DUF5666 domain-containing protein n=1 Tax=Micromonospora pisi TaxID=589240 RepID=A0A495JFY0_9ACTN|nr:hypothetical protein [Micromonospora pisi]RKR87685.1 hypothetical protein BDK92_1977 [Micromonospora pisi]